MAVDVPGWRARILELMRQTGLPDEDGPRVLDALAAEAVAAEREACAKVVEKNARALVATSKEIEALNIHLRGFAELLSAAIRARAA